MNKFLKLYFTVSSLSDLKLDLLVNYFESTNAYKVGVVNGYLCVVYTESDARKIIVDDLLLALSKDLSIEVGQATVLGGDLIIELS